MANNKKYICQCKCGSMDFEAIRVGKVRVSQSVQIDEDGNEIYGCHNILDTQTGAIKSLSCAECGEKARYEVRNKRRETHDKRILSALQ